MNLNKHNHFTLRITQVFTQLLTEPINHNSYLLYTKHLLLPSNKRYSIDCWIGFDGLCGISTTKKGLNVFIELLNF